MNASFHRPWYDHADGAPRDAPKVLLGAAQGLASVRETLTPVNVVVGGVLVLCWLALVGWTGVGSGGWQARSCAGLDLRPASCETVRLGKDASRIIPHANAAKLAP